AHTRCAEHVLYSERNSFERPGFALRNTCVGGPCHVGRTLRRFQHKRVERSCLLDRGLVRSGQFGSGEGFFLQAVARLGQSERGKFTHGVTHPRVGARRSSARRGARRTSRTGNRFRRKVYPCPRTRAAPPRERQAWTSNRVHRRCTSAKPCMLCSTRSPGLAMLAPGMVQ